MCVCMWGHCAQGDFVDVLDIFVDRVTHRHQQKWRMAEVLAVLPSRVFVHYSGWAPVFDNWVDVVKDAHRIA